MFFLSLLLTAAPALAETPEGWLVAGSAPDAYQAEVVDESRDGGKSARFGSLTSKRIRGFGTLMQTMQPSDYAGNRVRMSAWVKSSEVDGWAGLWLRIDGNTKQPLAFDNMRERAIHGDTEWTKYSIVLDVAPEATNIAYGVLISDSGTVWLDDVEFDIVSESEPLTGTYENRYEPQNSSFED